MNQEIALNILAFAFAGGFLVVIVNILFKKKK